MHAGHIESPILPAVRTPERVLTRRLSGDVLLKLAAAIYRKMDLASPHDVVQEGVDSVELMGDRERGTHTARSGASSGHPDCVPVVTHKWMEIIRGNCLAVDAFILCCCWWCCFAPKLDDGCFKCSRTNLHHKLAPCAV